MKRFALLAATGCVAAAQMMTPALSFAKLPLEKGWGTWRVEAAPNTREWCCYTWNRGRPVGKGCNLDKDEHDFGSIDGQLGRSEQMQFYLLINEEGVREIRTMSPRCPVTSSSDITDLGVVATQTSLGWLRDFVEADGELTQDALRAISTHVAAVPVLIEVIRNESLTMDTREQALFWLATHDTDEAWAFFEQLLSSTNRR